MDALGNIQGSSSPADTEVEGSPILLEFQMVLDVQMGTPCRTQCKERRKAQFCIFAASS